jgi:tungstate transport system substrate-binding protein
MRRESCFCSPGVFRNLAIVICLLLTGLATLGVARAQDRPFIVLQSTTSTQNSGLFDVILPMFTAKTGIDVRVVAVGTGQALKNAANGDGDVLLVHAKPDEEAFIAAGDGVRRDDVMYNDFVIVGPADDPAGIAGMKDATAALWRIAETTSVFVSRGDDSGTHKAELALWRDADFDPRAASGTWYREAGTGMGATLNTAQGMGGYVLVDRATWASFGNTAGLTVLVSGDAKLFNQYGVILVNPARHPQVKAKEGQVFIDWLIGPDGQAAIGAFRVHGDQVFFPNARIGS